MAHCQLTTLDLSTRVNLAVRMLDPQRNREEVSLLAHTYGPSRKFLYALRDRVRPAPGHPPAGCLWIRPIWTGPRSS